MAGRLEQYEQLTAYLDGELSGAERAEVERLLASDAEARALLEELRETARLIGTVPREFAGKGFNEAVRARLERESLLSEGSTQPMSWWKPMTLAASLMIVSTVVYFGMARLQQERERRVFAMVDAESARPTIASKSPALAQREPVMSRGQAAFQDQVAAAGRGDTKDERSELGMMRQATVPASADMAARDTANAPQAAPTFGVEVEEDRKRLEVKSNVSTMSVRDRGMPLLLWKKTVSNSLTVTSQPTSRPATSQPTSQPTTSQASGEKSRG